MYWVNNALILKPNMISMIIDAIVGVKNKLQVTAQNFSKAEKSLWRLYGFSFSFLIETVILRGRSTMFRAF